MTQEAHTPEQVGKMTSCPKCGLEAKTMLHPFCTHAECPVRRISSDKQKPSHSAEPWQVKHDWDIEGATTIIANADAEIDSEGTHYSYDTIAICHDQFDERMPEAQANARRIVACVNALAGIPIDAIESGVVAELVQALRGAEDAVQAAYAQVDAEWRDHDKAATRHDNVIRDWRVKKNNALAKLEASK